ncbi:hypothetical protein WN944_005883 [Citrus x changshan-huyou]|uniref:NB-ARC domain-containing protein n=1 Tax=Citrus x changshan-huyou TaxID=2935761 RepID=A0AAP0MK17_9ROSI
MSLKTCKAKVRSGYIPFSSLFSIYPDTGSMLPDTANIKVQFIIFMGTSGGDWLTKTILTSIVTHQNVDHLNLNQLQEELNKQLSGKKFLLVLDDMWNRNYDDWVDFSRPLGASAQGSKIIVSTRNHEVAKIMGTLSVYQLKKLSYNDCLAIFAEHSLGTRDFSSHMSLEEIGRKIVTKCDGLPLAAQTLGGLLRGEHDRREWERVLSSKIWELPEERCRIIPALAVSYYYLPPTLKQCFAYCSLLPKDYEFEEEEIILLWCASGFLDHKEDENLSEDLGRDFFKELCSRSFFQQSATDASRFVMHDLINDLARWAAGETYFTLEYTSEVHKQQSFSKNLRHLSCICGEYDGVKRFEDLYDIQHLRTFLPVMLINSSRGYLARSILPKLFKLQRLRVFSLHGYQISELPYSIGDLRYLRYLNLSGTEIRTLPESVNKLYNLHTLLLEGCRQLKKLCADMGNLIKLHHLNNSNTDSLEEMPVGIGKLTCLQSLSNFAVGKDSGSRLPELKLLMHLRGTLEISKLENVKDVDCGMCTTLPSVGQLSSLKHLAVRGMSRVKSLGSEFYGNDSPIPFRCLETLRFENMQEWEDWIPLRSGQGVEGFPKLRKLHIISCSKLQGTFPEHLPALEILEFGMQ